MRVYIGQTRARNLISTLNGHGFREMVSRGEWPPRRVPCAYDNGAFADWKARRAFDVEAFMHDVETIAAGPTRPDFLVTPDIVAGGPRSLDFSLTWVDRLRGVAPLYLAVQNGMTAAQVRSAAGPFAGIFVGGTLDWKLRTAASWVRLAHDLGAACHLGRVGTPRRVRWARRVGADSIDSCLPLWSTPKLRGFIVALFDAQLELPSMEPAEVAP